MAGIFINYRTLDAPFGAGAVFELLSGIFGETHVFRDCVSVAPGQPYPAAILGALDDADVLLAVIGPDWLLTDASGARAIDRDHDWVRREIARAFARGIPVVPVLLADARLPDRAELPADIAELIKQQAYRVRHETMGRDIRALADALVRQVPALRLPRLFLPAPTTDDGAAAVAGSPAGLLTPQAAVVAFAGRDAELAELTRWCEDGPALRVCLLTGRGGAGKTRIAQELVRLRRDRGWVAGLLREGVAAELEAWTSLATPLLAVVDYAEARADLPAVLRALARGAGPRRLLLLARGEGEWWRGVREEMDDALAQACHDATLLSLAPLVSSAAGWRAEYERAVVAFAARYRQPVPVAPSGEPELSTMDALEIHAAALADVLDARERGGAEPLPVGDPLARVLAHEHRYWARAAAASQLPDPHRERLHALATTATLCAPPTPVAAESAMQALRTFQRQPPDVIDRYRSWWWSLWPGPAALNPVLPDRLGEAHVVDSLLPAHSSLPAAVPAFIDVVDDDGLGRLLRVLARCAAGRPALNPVLTAALAADPVRTLPIAIRVAIESPVADPLVAAMCETVTTVGANDLLPVLAALPARTRVLAEFAVQALTTALGAHHAADHPDPMVAAQLHTQLAIRLGDRGDDKAALPHSEQAVALYRELAERAADPFALHLAIALANQAVLLRRIGQGGAAVRDVEEAARLVAGLPASRRATRYHAMILSMRASILAAVGEDPLPSSADAVALLAGDDSPATGMRAAIATVLHNHAVWLRRAGLRAESLALAGRAAELWRELADEEPDAFARPRTAIVGPLGSSAEVGDVLLAAAGLRPAHVTGWDLLALVGRASPAEQDEFIDAVIRTCAPIWDDPAAAPPDELALRTGSWHLDLTSVDTRVALVDAATAACLVRDLSLMQSVRWVAMVLPHLVRPYRADVDVDGDVLLRLRLRGVLTDEFPSPWPPAALAPLVHPDDLDDLVAALRGASDAAGELTVRLPVAAWR